jgi:hypothetical protein
MKKRTLRRLRRALKKKLAPQKRVLSIADARRAAEHYESHPS